MKRVFAWMERHEWFLICLATVILLRIPSLMEPYWYGDEGIYLAIGQAVRKGYVLYSQIHDNKPPFLYLVAALANRQIFWFKFMAGIFNLLSVGVFYKLVNKINKRRAVLATWVFALLTTLPILEGNIANAENFFLLFTVGAFYILWTKHDLKHVFWGGLVLGLGALFKMPPLIEAGIWPIYWIIVRDKKWFTKSLVLGLGVLLPIIVSVGTMFGLGAGREYLTAAWAQNLPYLTSWKATGVTTGIYSLKNRILVLLAGVVLTVVMRKKWQKTTIILGLWAIVTWFAALMSGRPYPHYLLQMAPVIALWTVSRQMLIAGWTGLIVTWALFQFYIYSSWGYYANFGKYIFGEISQIQYQNYFNSQVETNYKVAEKLKILTKPSEKIFVWGDEPMIYALSERKPAGKYLARYHIMDFGAKEVILKEFDKTPPRAVVTPVEFYDFPELLSFLHQKYLQVDKIGNLILWINLK